MIVKVKYFELYFGVNEINMKYFLIQRILYIVLFKNVSLTLLHLQRIQVLR